MFMDAWFATREEARNEFGRLCHAVPFERTLPLIRPGLHAVSHLECTPRTRALLADFKVVFVYRDLRDALVSWLRFHQDTGREAQWNWIWARHADPRERLVVFLREAGAMFFSMCRALAAFLDHPNPSQAPGVVLPDLTSTPTLTSSGSRTRRDEYWSLTAEELFLQLGGGELNAAFGYGG
jgi:hypothetical protein